MFKHLAIASIVLALGAAAAPAAEKNDGLIDQVLQHAAEGPNIVGEFLLGAADIREATARQALLADISGWLHENFDLPAIAEQPALAYVPPARIAELRYQGLLTARAANGTGDAPLQIGTRETVAVYSDTDKTIYLPEGWNGRTLAQLSMMVHEMVHHIQNLGHVRHECPRAREKLAYEAQEQWLQLYGHDLMSDFNIDPFTVLVSSTCAY